MVWLIGNGMDRKREACEPASLSCRVGAGGAGWQ